MVIGGGGWGVYAEPVELGGRIDAGPLDADGVTGFGERDGGDGEGDSGLEGRAEKEDGEEEEECEGNHI